MPNLKGWIFILRNWKLVIHLLVHTRKFGVNNQKAVSSNSIFSGYHKGFKYILSNYREAKLRATVCGFLTREECRNLGWKSTL